MCSIGFKSRLQVDLSSIVNTDDRSKLIFEFLHDRVFGSIQIEI